MQRTSCVIYNSFLFVSHTSFIIFTESQVSNVIEKLIILDKGCLFFFDVIYYTLMRNYIFEISLKKGFVIYFVCNFNVID